VGKQTGVLWDVDAIPSVDADSKPLLAALSVSWLRLGTPPEPTIIGGFSIRTPGPSVIGVLAQAVVAAIDTSVKHDKRDIEDIDLFVLCPVHNDWVAGCPECEFRALHHTGVGVAAQDKTSNEVRH